MGNLFKTLPPDRVDVLGDQLRAAESEASEVLHG